MKQIVDVKIYATFKGITYAPSVQEVDEEVAEILIARGFAAYVGDCEPTATVDFFEPLSIEETIKRFGEGDNANIVFDSLKHHQTEIVNNKPRSIGQSDSLSGILLTDSLLVLTPVADKLHIPSDFPQRHVFIGLGFKTIEEIQTKTKEQLVANKGIGETLADKALAYGK